MSIPFTVRVRVPDDVLVSELDGEAVLLKLKSEFVFRPGRNRHPNLEAALASDSVQSAYDARALGVRRRAGQTPR